MTKAKAKVENAEYEDPQSEADERPEGESPAELAAKTEAEHDDVVTGDEVKADDHQVITSTGTKSTTEGENDTRYGSAWKVGHDAPITLYKDQDGDRAVTTDKPVRGWVLVNKGDTITESIRKEVFEGKGA